MVRAQQKDTPVRQDGDEVEEREKARLEES